MKSSLLFCSFSNINNQASPYFLWCAVFVLFSFNSTAQTKLQNSDCGKSNVEFNTLLKAKAINGATEYEFRVEKSSMGYSQSVVKTTKSFKLEELSVQVNYNTKYDVKVRTKKAGNMGSYGPMCNITTKPHPTTKLQIPDCGKTGVTRNQSLRAETVTGATEYEFLVEKSSLGYSQSVVKTTKSFELDEMAVAVDFNTMYDVKVRSKVGTVMSPYGPMCNITTRSHPLTKLRVPDCGKTGISRKQLLRADAVIGASEYEFLVENSSLAYSQTVTKATKSFMLDEMAVAVDLNTTYNVKVRTKIGASMGPYGPMCNVTTRQHPLTKLRIPDCGKTGVAKNQMLRADAVKGASEYEFLVENSSLSYSQTVTKTQRSFMLDELAVAVNGSTTYDVKVRTKIGQSMGPYGPMCPVTTKPTALITQLEAGDCGATGVTLNQLLKADRITGANQYDFLVENSALSFSQVVTKTNKQFRLSDLAGPIQFNTTYKVRVRATVGAIATAYGPVCQVTTEADPLITQLQTKDCGATGVTQAQLLKANLVQGASQYEFSVRNTSLGFSQSAIKSNRLFRLSDLTGPILSNTVYEVAVRVTIGGATGAYGPVCLITSENTGVFVPPLGDAYSINAPVDDGQGGITNPPMTAFDRFGNEYLLEDIRIPQNSHVAGIFRLHFIDFEPTATGNGFDDQAAGTFFGTLGQDRREVVIQVFEDISNLLVPAGLAANLPQPYNGTQYVEILIMHNTLPNNDPLPATALGAASQFYIDAGTGLAYGEVWKTINTGFDSYYNLANTPFAPGLSYHGFATFNFRPGIQWYNDLTGISTITGNKYDLYTVVLHETMHALGFASLIGQSGTGIGGTGRYSLFDTYLEFNGTPLINSTSNPLFCYDANLNVTTGNLSSACGNISFNGSGTLNGNHLVYSRNPWKDGSSLSHFNCNAPLAGYVMNQATSPLYIQRTPHEAEVQTLCDLGYNIQSTYGNGDYAISGTNYTNACSTPNNEVAGANDFRPYNQSNTCSPDFTVEAGQTRVFVDFGGGSCGTNGILDNDNNADEIACVEIVIGGVTATNILNSTAQGFTYQPPLTFSGQAMLKYRPYNTTNNKYGNITYVFVNVTAPPLPPCDPNDCNLVCHGDFEAVTNNYVVPLSIAITGNYSPDLYSPFTNPTIGQCGAAHPNVDPNGGNNFIGLLGNPGEEAVSFQLNKPVEQNKTYTISFLATTKPSISCSSQPSINIMLSPTAPCPLSTINCIANGCVTNCGNGTFGPTIHLGATTIAQNATAWDPYSFQYTVPNGTPDQNFLIVYNDGFYGYLDNVSIVEVNTTPLVINATPSDLNPCVGDVITITYDICLDQGPVTNANPIDLHIVLPPGLSITGGNFNANGDFTIPANTLANPCVYSLTTSITVGGGIIPGQPIDIDLTTLTGGCTGSQTSTTSVQITPGFDNILSITKTAVGGPNFNVGDAVTFEILVQNTSFTQTVSGITIDDVLPTEFDAATVVSADFNVLGVTLTSVTPFTLVAQGFTTLTFTVDIDVSGSCSSVMNCANIITADGACDLPISGCTTINIDLPSPPISASYFGCGAPGDLNAIGSAIRWYSSSVIIPANQIGTGSPFNASVWLTNPGSTTLYVTQTVAGCESLPTAVTINILALPNPPVVLSVVACSTPVNLSVLGVLGTSTTWYSSPILIPANQIATGTTLNATPFLNQPGLTTFYVTATNIFSGCESTASISTVDLYLPPKMSFLPLPQCVCTSSDCIDLTTFASPSTGTFSGTGVNSFTGEFCPSTAGAGTHTITHTVFSGPCSYTQNQSITVGSPVTASQGLIGLATCTGICNASAMVLPSGGTAPYSYSWNDPISQNTQIATNLCEGDYTVIVFDNCGFTATVDLTVGAGTSPFFVLSGASNATCINTCNGTATANGVGGVGPYGYLWNTGETTPSITGLCPRGYQVTVTDNNGCENTANVTSGINFSVNVTSTNSTCDPGQLGSGPCTGTVTATPSGGTAPYTYLWLGGIFPFPTTQSVSNVCPGAGLEVTVTDANGCIAEGTEPVISDMTLTASFTRADCGVCNGTATATPSGGVTPYTYTWYNSASDFFGNIPSGQTTPTLTGLCGSDLRLVLVTDANGCSMFSGVTVLEKEITVPTPPTFATTCGLCDGSATVNPSGGTPFYTYLWSDGQTSQTATNLCPGTYWVTIDDANGCQTLVSNITVVDGIYAGPDITIGGAGCPGVSYYTIGTPPQACASYSWSPSTGIFGPTNVAQPTVFWTGGGAVTYTVTVTVGACTATDQVVVTPIFCRMAEEEEEAQNTSGSEKETVITSSDNVISSRIHPNPTTGLLTVELSMEEDVNTRVAIYSVHGQELELANKSRSAENRFEFDLSNEPGGVYFVRIQAGYRVISKRIVLVK